MMRSEEIAIREIDTSRAGFLPFLSPMYPIKRAPRGLAKKPIAKAEKLKIRDTAGSEIGKKSFAKRLAKYP